MSIPYLVETREDWYQGLASMESEEATLDVCGDTAPMSDTPGKGVYYDVSTIAVTLDSEGTWQDGGNPFSVTISPTFGWHSEGSNFDCDINGDHVMLLRYPIVNYRFSPIDPNILYAMSSDVQALLSTAGNFGFYGMVSYTNKYYDLYWDTNINNPNKVTSDCDIISEQLIKTGQYLCYTENVETGNACTLLSNGTIDPGTSWIKGDMALSSCKRNGSAAYGVVGYGPSREVSVLFYNTNDIMLIVPTA
jgi:hypothetical protein